MGGLLEVSAPVRYLYSLLSGLVSLLTPVHEYTSVEVGVVGSEGVEESPLPWASSSRLWRLWYRALEAPADEGRPVWGSDQNASPPAASRESLPLLPHGAGRTTAAYNLSHVVAQRLARWLLMTQDRMDSDAFYLTQDFLAHMRSVRRVGVSAAAGGT